MDRSKKTSTQAGKPLEKGDTFTKGVLDEVTRDQNHSVGDEYGAPMWSHDHDAGLDEHAAEQQPIFDLHDSLDMDCGSADE